MSFQGASANALDELPCRYGESKLLMRGPRRNLTRNYFAMLGGTETYGKFIPNPFPALLEQDLGKPCINLGAMNAGLDAFVYDRDVVQAAAAADLAVVQLLSAHNLSNRYFRVHPRRNDRFIEASTLLSTIFSEVDFTEFHFNKHMLGTLKALSPERFAMVEEELRQAWKGRMKLLMKGLRRKPILLWLRYKELEIKDEVLSSEPVMIDQSMVDDLLPFARGVIEVDVQLSGETGDTDGMVFGQMQAAGAKHLLGPQAHRQIADALGDALVGVR